MLKPNRFLVMCRNNDLGQIPTTDRNVRNSVTNRLPPSEGLTESSSPAGSIFCLVSKFQVINKFELFLRIVPVTVNNAKYCEEYDAPQ